MRPRCEQILAMLRATPGVVSYRWLRYVLGISQNNLCRHITELRIAGYRIECARRLGFRLA